MDKTNLTNVQNIEPLPLVSIIIPVYNGEKYVSKCLYSVVNQTYSNLEIIVINDGSKDTSLKICCDFDYSGHKIRIINNNNHGPGYSRNCGLNVAKGEYVIFVDCDDVIHENYVELLVKTIVTEKNDLVICRVVDLFINENESVIKKRWRLIPQNLTNDFLCDYHKLYPETVYLSGPVAKVYKKDIIDKYNITFPVNISWGEDQAFNQIYYKYVHSFSFVANTYYYYCHRNNYSLTKKFDNKNFEERLLLIEKVKKFLNEIDVKNKEMILGDYCFHVINVSDLVKSNGTDKGYIGYKNRIKLLQDIVQDKWKGSNWQRKLVFFFFNQRIYFPFYIYAKLRRFILSSF